MRRNTGFKNRESNSCRLSSFSTWDEKTLVARIARRSKREARHRSSNIRMYWASFLVPSMLSHDRLGCVIGRWNGNVTGVLAGPPRTAREPRAQSSNLDLVRTGLLCESWGWTTWGHADA